MKLIRTNIILPQDLLDEISKVVGKRQRSRFITEAAREKLKRIKLQKALEKAAGAWREENHPELKRGVDAYVRKLRTSWRKREKSLFQGRNNG
ncbi:MAG: hypothetical protein QMD66_06510 [Actinomycetota bacterium]|nr:hypothetical protein [Actinomycetota bacterium]MDI6822489.1 hypothetical protein [Actinomycetota bacterium]